jgi:hypothetical protein
MTEGPLDEALRRLSRFGPSRKGAPDAEPLPEFELIITTDKKHLGGGRGDTNVYYAATNLPELLRDRSAKPKVFLHPAWFDLPELKQLEILYWCLMSQLTKRIADPHEAFEDAKTFIKYYRSQRSNED